MKPLVDSEFRMDDTAAQTDGKWHSTMRLRYDAIPAEEGVFMSLYVCDRGESYPGKVQQTLYIPFP